MGIVLYYFPISAPCRAVQMAATNIGIHFEIKTINIMAGEHLKPEFLKVNPQHTIPVLDDNGFIMTESRAIIQYLANAYERHDILYPKMTRKRALVDQRLIFDMGTLYKTFGDIYFPILLENQKLDPEKVKKYNESLGFLEDYLKQTKYSAGDTLSLADFSIMATLSTSEAAGHDLSKFRLVLAYMKRCKIEIKDYDLNDKGAKEFGDLVKYKLKNLR